MYIILRVKYTSLLVRFLYFYVALKVSLFLYSCAIETPVRISPGQHPEFASYRMLLLQ